MNELMAECEVSEEVFAGGLNRLRQFVEPFAVLLCRQEQVEHARTYVAGLLSNLEWKNASSVPRAKPVWPIMKSGRGEAGITIKRFRLSPRGSWSKRPSGGKTSTPALTVPRVRAAVAMLLHYA